MLIKKEQSKKYRMQIPAQFGLMKFQAKTLLVQLL